MINRRLNRRLNQSVRRLGITHVRATLTDGVWIAEVRATVRGKQTEIAMSGSSMGEALFKVVGEIEDLKNGRQPIAAS